MGMCQLQRLSAYRLPSIIASEPGRAYLSRFSPSLNHHHRMHRPPSVAFRLSRRISRYSRRFPVIRFVVQKHLHGFVQDGGAGSGDTPGDAHRRGNLDIVGLQFDRTQRERKLSPAASAQVSTLVLFGRARPLCSSSRKELSRWCFLPIESASAARCCTFSVFEGSYGNWPLGRPGTDSAKFGCHFTEEGSTLAR